MNTTENNIITNILIIIGFIEVILILCKFVNKSLEFTYQYVGKIRDILITVSGNHSVGIKAPHRKAEPNAITFTTPLTAFLSSIRVDISSARVRELNVNIKAFKPYIKPLKDNIVLLKMTVPNIIYRSQTITE